MAVCVGEVSAVCCPLSGSESRTEPMCRGLGPTLGSVPYSPAQSPRSRPSQPDGWSGFDFPSITWSEGRKHCAQTVSRLVANGVASLKVKILSYFPPGVFQCLFSLLTPSLSVARSAVYLSLSCAMPGPGPRSQLCGGLSRSKSLSSPRSRLGCPFPLIPLPTDTFFFRMTEWMNVTSRLCPGGLWGVFLRGRFLYSVEHSLVFSLVL